MSEKRPIIFEEVIGTRFTDMDPYGHLNASKYLDYVLSGRWSFLEKVLKVTNQELVKRGFGFFIVNANINYKRSISDACDVTVKSWISKKEDCFLFIDFSIERNGKIVSDGSLKYAVIDMNTGLKTPPPDWVDQLLYH